MRRLVLLFPLIGVVAGNALAQQKAEATKGGDTAAPEVQAPAAKKPEGPRKEWKEVFDDWILACAQGVDGQKSCAISQTLTNKQNRRTIGVISIGKDKAGKMIANLQAPLGFAVNQGIKLVIDSDAGVPVPVRTCLASGCLGIVELGQPLVGRLQKASQLAVSVQNLQAKTVVVNFSVKGLTRAFDKLVKEASS